MNKGILLYLLLEFISWREENSKKSRSGLRENVWIDHYKNQLKKQWQPSQQVERHTQTTLRPAFAIMAPRHPRRALSLDASKKWRGPALVVASRRK
jgi:hypothetical protein